jgi:hypothetical protein
MWTEAAATQHSDAGCPAGTEKHREVIQTASEEPSRECRFWLASLDGCYAVLQGGRDAKDDRITRHLIWKFTSDGNVALFSELKAAAQVRPGPEVQTHAHEAVFSYVVVPGVVVVRSRNHLVHAPLETCNCVAPGKVPDHGEKGRCVRDEVQQINPDFRFGCGTFAHPIRRHALICAGSA